MVSQEKLWNLIKEMPGHTISEYADIMSEGNKQKSFFYKSDMTGTAFSLTKYRLIVGEWDMDESGVFLHYYPLTLVPKENPAYNAEDYSEELVADRILRGWTEESAKYAFPPNKTDGCKYIQKYAKGITQYIRKHPNCSFDDIAQYLCKAHTKMNFIPRCRFNVHLRNALTIAPVQSLRVGKNCLAISDGKSYITECDGKYNVVSKVEI